MMKGKRLLASGLAAMMAMGEVSRKLQYPQDRWISRAAEVERGIFRNGSAWRDIAIPLTIWAIMLRNSNSTNADCRILAAG